MSHPTRLGRYQVRRRLGAGAFATVWLAVDDQLDSEVAIKVLADNWAGDAHVRRRFVEEGRFLRKVDSPYVVPVYDAGELDDGRPYLVMAYADRGTLADRLALGPVPAPEALRILVELGTGLQALHDRDVLHRDVKPGNVLLRGHDDGERAMLADLGLGKALDVSSRLTVIAGTPAYVAPEQARGEGLDARADLYSLAALAHLLLTGRPARAPESLAVAGSPPPVPPMGAAVPPAVEAAVLRALCVDREDRQASVAEFVAELTQAGRADGTLIEPARSTPARTAPARDRGLPALFAATALVLAGAGLGAWAADSARGEHRVSDTTGTLAVTVPAAWTSSVQGDGWTPPDSDQVLPALALGTDRTWRTEGQGVFAGLAEGDDLPARTPGHPECADERPGPDAPEGVDALTVVHTGCPAPAPVVVERVARVAEDRLLWVQVRSSDLAAAERALAGVELDGMAQARSGTDRR
ncbi:serine/threonine-protein kinase [Nocardioides campestrisoli]|uniref:serine/threonine-protein kinase n=1 Tax=Nocardioides campestrisoli TaxID=2736757 RepID=UPI001CD6F4F7|nr:serine/threonine-protein kinase [Nocardioides campestrisoli]